MREVPLPLPSANICNSINFNSCMQLAFYKKDPLLLQSSIIVRKPSFKTKSKRHFQFADYKGLTLREYFARSEKPSERNSDGSEEKESASFEGLPTNVMEKVGLGVISEDIKGRIVTEMGEKQSEKHRQRLKGNQDQWRKVHIIIPQKEECPVMQCFPPVEQTLPSSPIIVLRRRPKDTNKNASYVEQPQTPLNHTKPIHHISPQNASPRTTLEWQKLRVYSNYPQLQGARGKTGRLKEMLHKLVSQSSPQLKGEIGKCLNLLARK